MANIEVPCPKLGKTVHVALGPRDTLTVVGPERGKSQFTLPDGSNFTLSPGESRIFPGPMVWSIKKLSDEYPA